MVMGNDVTSGDNHDYVALEWVRGEVTETLNQIRQALESLEEDPSNENQLVFCQTALHQIYGTLSIVGFHGPAMLAEEMERLANALVEKNAVDAAAGLQVLMQAILQLPTYLELIQSTRHDLPVTVLPLVNEMRASRGAPALSEGVFFSVQQAENRPSLTMEELLRRDQQGPGLSWLKKLRQLLQSSLIALIKGQDKAQSLERMRRVFGHLWNFCVNSQLAPLWKLSGAVVEGMLEGAIGTDKEVLSLLGRADRELKVLVDQGAEGMNHTPPEQLVNSLFFVIAKANSSNPLVLALQDQYHLQEMLAAQQETAVTDRARLYGPDRETIQSAVKALNEELSHIRDDLDLFVRSGESDTGKLQEMLPRMKMVADTLGVLKISRLGQLTMEQYSALQSMLDGQASPDSVALLEMAGVLLSIESQLQAIILQPGMIAEADDSVSGGAFEAHLAVIHEIQNSLQECKEVLSSLSPQAWDVERLKVIPGILDQSQGALSIVPLPKAASILSSCSSYVKEHLLSGKEGLTQDRLEALAGAITTVEYYLERLLKDPGGTTEELLEFGDNYLEDLYAEDVVVSDCSLSPGSTGLTGMPASISSPAADGSSPASPSGGATAKKPIPPISILPPDEGEEETDPELIEVFVEEIGDILETFSEYLPRWLQDADDFDAMIEVRRAFHTLKGSGRMVKALIIGELAWAIENMLNKVRDGIMPASMVMQELVQKVVALVPELRDEFAAGKQHARADVDYLATLAHAVADGIDVSPDKVNLAPGATTGGAFGEISSSEGELSQPQPSNEGVVEAGDISQRELVSAVQFQAAPKNESSDRHDEGNALLEVGAFPESTVSGSTEFPGNITVEPSESSLTAQIQPERAESSVSNYSFSDSISSSVVPEDVDPFSGAPTVETAPVDATSLLPENAAVETVSAPELIQESVELEADPLSEEDLELLEIFISEAQGHLDVLESFIAACDQLLPQMVPDEVQRAMHTLKGSARIAGIEPIAAIATPFEQMLKECRVNLWPIELVDVELLRDADYLLRSGLEHLQENPKAPIAGGQSLVDRITERRHSRLAQVDALRQASDEVPADTTPITTLLMEGLDALLDAQETVETWRDSPSSRPEALNAVEQELEALGNSAQMAGLQQLKALCRAVGDLYRAQREGMVDTDAAFFLLLEEAHNGLMAMMDQVMAGLVVSDQPQTVASIGRLLEESGKKHSSAVDGSGMLIGEATPSVQESPAQVDAEVIAESEPEVEAMPDTGSVVNQVADVVSVESGQELSVDPLESHSPVDEIPPVAVGVEDPTDDVDPEMAEIFIEEAEDLLEEAENELDRWIHSDNTEEALPALQRQLHTVKGGARMCGAQSIGTLAHELEFVYEGLLNKKYHRSPALVELVQRSHDSLQSMLDELKNGQALSFPTDIVVSLKAFRQSGQIVSAIDTSTRSVEPVVEKPSTTVQPAQESAQFPAAIEKKPGLPAPESMEQEIAAVTINPELESLSLQGETPVQTQIPEIQESQGLVSVDGSLAIASREVVSEPDSVEAVDKTASPAAAVPAQVTGKEGAEQVRVAADLLDNLVNLAGETSIYRSRIEQQASDLNGVLAEMEATIDRVRDQLRRLDTETQTQIISRHHDEFGREGYEDFDPLEMDQYSQLQQLSRSLFESASDLFDLKETLARRNRDMETLLHQQARVNTELQEGLMQAQMVPFERIAPRLRRIVRQVAGELGKKIDLSVVNAVGEMDRSVLDGMVAPLEHMLRNAIDHGIESPEQRIAAGKSATGHIRLEVSREGGEIVTRISDDGAGIHVDAVRKKAVALGLLAENEPLSDQEVAQFILQAGFSTATRVTQISGRGVGMDVATNAIRQLGGSLSLSFRPGQGTEFVIRLPLSLAVSRTLMVRCGEEVYAIPMSTIEGIARVPPQEIEPLYRPGAEGVEYGGERYKLRYLGDLLGSGAVPHTDMQALSIPILLVHTGDMRVAIQMDELMPSEEIVVKNLGPQFNIVPSISGATIMGDGRVIIILDLPALVRTNYEASFRERVALGVQAELTAQVEQQIKRPPLVMVVDDSVTVRKVTGRLLERNGMNVLTARDGVDAIAQLQEQVPDVMLLDIEMPRMDGFEVATRVRRDEHTKALPIIMITSRSGDKHRQRAMEIGVNDYMSKPYQEQQLLTEISRWLPDSVDKSLIQVEPS